MWYRRLFLACSLMLNLLLLWALIWGEQGFFEYNALKQECIVLADRLDSLNDANIALSREIRLLRSDDKYMEQMIRKRLNFVKNNELWYIFTGGQGTLLGEVTDETKN